MNAKRFISESGQDVWANADNTVVSAAIEINDETLDLETGWSRNEKFIFWVKGNSQEVVESQITMLITKINSGKLAAVRVFFKEPLHEKHQEDVNPSTGETLGRYSQVRLCAPSKRDELHRQFLENPTKVEVKEDADLPVVN